MTFAVWVGCLDKLGNTEESRRTPYGDTRWYL
jgi:hypothetical protein